MFEALTTFLLGRLVGLLPRTLLRHLLPPSWVASQIAIDLRRANPISIAFGTEIPSISLCFRISNLSPVDLVLDRLLIDLWVGQPTLRGAILERYDVPKRSHVENVYFTDLLTVPQQAHIKKRVNGQLLSVPVSLNLMAYFESKVGLVTVRQSLEQRDVPVR